MILKMISFFISLTITGVLSVDPDYPEPVKGDSLESTFFLGPADLFWQTGFHNASLDRMSFQFNSGRYGYTGSQPVFMLNSIPFDPSFFGISFSQFLPEPFSRIEEISVKKGSGVYKGTGYSSGLIQLNSEPMKDGLSLFVSGQYGHNGGEPGPWVFDPERVTPNVERFGPWLDAGAGLKLGGWYAKGTLRTHSNKNVDEFVQMRMFNLRGFPARNEFLSVENTAMLGMIETGFESEWADIKFQAIHAESRDFLYFKPLAREIPTQLESNQYSATGRFAITENTGFRLLYQYREKRTLYRRNHFEHELDWKQQSNIFRGNFFYEGNRTSTEIGAEHKRIKTIAMDLEDGLLNPSRFFLKQRLFVTEAIELGTVQQITYRESEFALQSTGTVRLHVGSRWITEVEGGFSELFPEYANQIDYWVKKGYGIFDHLELDYTLPETIGNMKKTTFANRNLFQVAAGLQLETEFEFINHLSMNIPFQSAQYDLTFSTMPGRYVLHDSESGRRYQLTFSATHTLSDKFTQKANFLYHRTIGGGEIYRQYWKTIPEYVVQYEGSYKPFSDIAMTMRLQYRSESEWAEFVNLDGELNRSYHIQYPFQYYHYSNKLPEHVRLDLSVSKWFWEQRFRLALTLKNLFNENFQTHPIGTREGFGYYVRLDIRF